MSAAAQNLSLSQSTVSMALARLREHFDDPLFVRTSIGMEPTPRGAELIEVMKIAEFYLHQALEQRSVFDPLKSNQNFQLCSTDIAQLTLLPALMKRLRRSGPSMSVTLRNISDRTHVQLESGEVDLAVGFIQPKGAGFCGQRLFRDRFVCAMRSDHPRVDKTLTIQQFEAESHVAVTTSGTGHSIVEETLRGETHPPRSRSPSRQFYRPGSDSGQYGFDCDSPGTARHFLCPGRKGQAGRSAVRDPGLLHLSAMARAPSSGSGEPVVPQADCGIIHEQERRRSRRTMRSTVIL